MADLAPVVLAATIAGGLSFGANYITSILARRNVQDQLLGVREDKQADGSIKRIELWETNLSKDNERLRLENKEKDEEIVRLSSRVQSLEKRVSEYEQITHDLRLHMEFLETRMANGDGKSKLLPPPPP